MIHKQYYTILTSPLIVDEKEGDYSIACIYLLEFVIKEKLVKVIE